MLYYKLSDAVIHDNKYLNANNLQVEAWNPIQFTYSKTCIKQPLKKKAKIGFQDQLFC